MSYLTLIINDIIRLFFCKHEATINTCKHEGTVTYVNSRENMNGTSIDKSISIPFTFTFPYTHSNH